MIRFLITLLVVSLFLVGGTLLGYHQHWISEKPSFLYETLILFIFGTTLIYRYLYKVEKPGSFVQLYLLTIVVKLIAFGAYALAIIMKDGAGALANAVFFIISYFIFTGLEAGFVYHRKTILKK